MEQPIRAITLKDVAQAANVSRMTVSLALRDHSSLPVQTRRRIQQLAKSLGYRPDPQISKLMEQIRSKKPHGKGNVIAYVTAYEDPFAWRKQPTQRMYYEGALCRADECGFVLREFCLKERGMTEKRLSEVIRNRGIEGILLGPLPEAKHLFQEFRWEYFSSVKLGHSLLSPSLHRACNQQFQSMVLLLQRLQLAGYREIGLAMALSQDARVNFHWRAAFLATQSLQTKGRKIPMLFSDKWSKAQFDAWFKKYRPEVVVTIGPDVHQWANESGIEVPAEVGIANVDLRPEMNEVTGIDQNSDHVGAAAVDLLISLMKYNERGLPEHPKTLMVDGHFVQGKTTLVKNRIL